MTSDTSLRSEWGWASIYSTFHWGKIMMNPGRQWGLRPPHFSSFQKPCGVAKCGVPNRGVPSRGVPSRGVPEQGVRNRGVPERGVPERGVPTRGVPTRGTGGSVISRHCVQWMLSCVRVLFNVKHVWVKQTVYLSKHALTDLSNEIGTKARQRGHACDWQKNACTNHHQFYTNVLLLGAQLAKERSMVGMASLKSPEGKASMDFHGVLDVFLISPWELWWSRNDARILIVEPPELPEIWGSQFWPRQTVRPCPLLPNCEAPTLVWDDSFASVMRPFGNHPKGACCEHLRYIMKPVTEFVHLEFFSIYAIQMIWIAVS